MAHYTLIWELGFGISYAKHMALIAKQLLAKKQYVSIICKDIPLVQSFLAEAEVLLYQAPYYHCDNPEKLKVTDFNGAYPEILSANQYDDPALLSSLIKAWQTLYDTIKPDVIVCEHAPTAILASGDRVPIIQIGSGTLTPSAHYEYFPSILGGDARHEEQSKLLGSMNQVIKNHGVKPLKKFGDLFKHCQQVITSLPEFDPDHVQTGRRHIGPLELSAQPARERKANEHQIYVYLPAYHPNIVNLLKGLMNFKDEALIQIRDIKEDTAVSLSSVGYQLYDGDDYEQCIADARFVLHYGGLAMCQQVLYSGASQMLSPFHGEQRFNADVLHQNELGIYAKVNATPEAIAHGINWLLKDTKIINQAHKKALELHKNKKEPLSELIKIIESAS